MHDVMRGAACRAADGAAVEGRRRLKTDRKISVPTVLFFIFMGSVFVFAGSVFVFVKMGGRFSVRFRGIPFSPEIEPYLFYFYPVLNLYEMCRN
jgi:hypothetical protein